MHEQCRGVVHTKFSKALLSGVMIVHWYDAHHFFQEWPCLSSIDDSWYKDKRSHAHGSKISLASFPTLYSAQSLQRKAEARNPDEFYFAMEKSKTKGGVHDGR